MQLGTTVVQRMNTPISIAKLTRFDSQKEPQASAPLLRVLGSALSLGIISNTAGKWRENLEWPGLGSPVHERLEHVGAGKGLRGGFRDRGIYRMRRSGIVQPGGGRGITSTCTRTWSGRKEESRLFPMTGHKGRGTHQNTANPTQIKKTAKKFP